MYRNRRIRPFYPGFERDKHWLYFEKHGLRLVRQKKWVITRGKARCDSCNQRWQTRMARLERDWIAVHPESQILEDVDALTRRQRTAQELLREVRT